MRNLMQILSIFLKLQAVKQSGPGFLAYPVHHVCKNETIFSVTFKVIYKAVVSNVT